MSEAESVVKEGASLCSTCARRLEQIDSEVFKKLGCVYGFDVHLCVGGCGHLTSGRVVSANARALVEQSRKPQAAIKQEQRQK